MIWSACDPWTRRNSWTTWQPIGLFGNYEIGIALFPEYRGRGVGTEAQRRRVEYLFNTTTARRLPAGTEVDNLAGWRDSIMYAQIREDWPASVGT